MSARTRERLAQAIAALALLFAAAVIGAGMFFAPEITWEDAR